MGIEGILNIALLTLLAVSPLVMLNHTWVGEWVFLFGSIAIFDLLYGTYSHTFVYTASAIAFTCFVLGLYLPGHYTLASILAISVIFITTEALIITKSAGEAERLLYLPLVITPFIGILGFIGGGLIQTIGRHMKIEAASRFVFTAWLIMLICIVAMPHHSNQICNDYVLNMTGPTNCSRLILFEEHLNSSPPLSQNIPLSPSGYPHPPQ